MLSGCGVPFDGVACLRASRVVGDGVRWQAAWRWGPRVVSPQFLWLPLCRLAAQSQCQNPEG
eukprot:4220788-Pyramimonas_sp.AAC.1